MQAQHESKKDFWRVFLNFNYKDFKDQVSVIKPINKSGAIVFFPYLSPQMFQGLDTLKTGLDTKITIGDGGLFSQPFQNITNSDLSNEYGSCENLRSVMNTPMGLFYISQAQGKIFHYAGRGLDPISNKGMKWWFNKYLPSQLIKQYPELEKSVLSDNPVVGVGCQSIYDPNDDIAYFMKKDYRVKSEYIAMITFDLDLGFRLNGPISNIPLTLGDPIYFDDASWTISYDPKTQAWISFHDWHPEFALPSINHFFTTTTLATTIPQCPPGYNFNPETGLCEISASETAISTVTVEELVATVTGGGQDCILDIVVAMDWSGSTGTPIYNPVTGSMGNTDASTAQLRWLDVFLNNPAITAPMAAGQMQIGFQGWDHAGDKWLQGGTSSMTNTVTGTEAVNWYISVWSTLGGGGTGVPAAIGTATPTSGNGGLAQLNDKANSSLGDRTGSAEFKQILIVVTDGTDGTTETNVAEFQTPSVISNSPPTDPGQAPNTGAWALANLGDAYKQEIYSVFCGSDTNVPSNPKILNNASNSSYDTDTFTPGGNQFTMNAENNLELDQTADNIADSVCALPFTCNCPAGYTKVFINPITHLYTESTGDCNAVAIPICRRVTCTCPQSPFPGSETTITGICPDSAPKIFSLGNPTWVDPTPQVCSYFYLRTTPPNYNVGSFWRHNSRCDSFANFYNDQYPWEIELVANTGQSINTVRSMEYQLEVYVYKNDPGYLCGDDKWEDLLFNFDQSIIYNNEQVSGLLLLTPTPFNNPILELTYPIVNPSNINILCSKVEQKYRFNQFWDITNDRGEFTIAEQPIWNTEVNGYIKNLNPINLNYFKSPLQHKKFRHYFTNVILRRINSENRKMLLRLNNTKLLTSLR